MIENKSQEEQELYNEISLKEVLYNLWLGKKIILAVTAFFLVVSIIISLLLPNIYQSKALLNPVNEGGGLGTAFQSLSGLAAYGGIDIASMENSQITDKALEKLNSLSFFSNNFLPNIYLPNLMAVKSWDSKTNTILYDKNIYDVNSNKWVRDFDFPQTQIPSAQESYEDFIDYFLEVTTNKKTGFISISINHKSPFIAKEWVELIVEELNRFFITEDKSEAITAIEYLNEQMAKTRFTEVKEAIAELLQKKIQEPTLMEASNFYVLEYIDPPVVMEEKAEPFRPAIILVSSILGLFLGISFVLLRKYFLK